MDGLPVTVRLLDPPLHEFLPSVEELRLGRRSRACRKRRSSCWSPPSRGGSRTPCWARGVRLGVVKPGLYAMQVRALMEAALDRAKAGGKPVVEIMIPLTVTGRRWRRRAPGSPTPSTRR